jgi:hypothetical protein
MWSFSVTTPSSPPPSPFSIWPGQPLQVWPSSPDYCVDPYFFGRLGIRCPSAYNLRPSRSLCRRHFCPDRSGPATLVGDFNFNLAATDNGIHLILQRFDLFPDGNDLSELAGC